MTNISADDQKLLEMLGLENVPDEDKQVILQEVDERMSKRFIANLLTGLSDEQSKKLEAEVNAMGSEDPAKIIEKIIAAHPDARSVLEKTGQEILMELKQNKQSAPATTATTSPATSETPAEMPKGESLNQTLDEKPPIEQVSSQGSEEKTKTGEEPAVSDQPSDTPPPAAPAAPKTDLPVEPSASAPDMPSPQTPPTPPEAPQIDQTQPPASMSESDSAPLPTPQNNPPIDVDFSPSKPPASSDDVTPPSTPDTEVPPQAPIESTPPAPEPVEPPPSPTPPAPSVDPSQNEEPPTMPGPNIDPASQAQATPPEPDTVAPAGAPQDQTATPQTPPSTPPSQDPGAGAQGQSNQSVSDMYQS